jgi:hypothetical protein
MESSPGILAVILELTENARDNATEITLTFEVEKHRLDKGRSYLVPKSITCEDNGTGLSHWEFLNRFCAAFADSESHHDVDRAGRNGVGTKTYLSIAERVVVRTTTGRSTYDLDKDRDIIRPSLPTGIKFPQDGEPDSLWRAYEFKLHNRSALPSEWKPAEAEEMGTSVSLVDLRPGVEICHETLIERLSYSREWLSHAAHKFTIQLTGNLPESMKSQRRVILKPWQHPQKPCPSIE